MLKVEFIPCITNLLSLGSQRPGFHQPVKGTTHLDQTAGTNQQTQKSDRKKAFLSEKASP